MSAEPAPQQPGGAEAEDKKKKKGKKGEKFIPLFRWPEIRLGIEWEFDSPTEFAKDQLEGKEQPRADNNADTKDRPLAHSIGFTIPKVNYGITVPPLPESIINSSTKLRRLFPACSRFSDTAFMDNASATQLPQSVISAMQEAMVSAYANSSLPSTQGKAAARVERRAHSVMSLLFNANEIGTIALGASATQLSERLCVMCDYLWNGEGEVVLSSAAHASVRGPFEALANRGNKIIDWDPAGPDNVTPIDALDKGLGPKTNLVVFSHANSVTGEIADIQGIVKVIRDKARNAKILVDGSLYAQHRYVDVESYGVDYYVVSLHKMYGPHLGALFLATNAAKELTGPNHAFIEVDDWPKKFELGTLSAEACAGVEGMQDFYSQVANAVNVKLPPQPTGPSAGNANNLRIPRELLTALWRKVAPLEQSLCWRLVAFLRAAPGVTVYGKHADVTESEAEEEGEDGEFVANRSQLPVVAFTHSSVAPEAIWKALNAAKIVGNFGHCNCPTLCESLGVNTATGFVRLSIGMYNSAGDVEKIIETLSTVLK